ncbi:hypothetical protein [Halorubrum halophilum]|uniref:hypothetical protein n=1 Tax=Halorubrum halophilum TaxID=413816 RepID=UPI001F3EE846|nr:hypothetical protein [Halorubrum halophilum]
MSGFSYVIADDVADDLENYLRTKERAEELNAKIEQTDRFIDEIVYELWRLTERNRDCRGGCGRIDSERTRCGAVDLMASKVTFLSLFSFN